MTRREALRNVGCGFGMLGLAGLLEQESRAAGTLAPQAPHFPAKAKHVIYLFLNGGPSHVDTFDPKPSLSKYDGKQVPSEFAKKDDQHSRLLGSPFQFQRYGESGLEVSELFPHVGKCIDEVCVLRSMYCDLPAHPQAIIQANTGRIIPGQPSMGSWLTYGLGTENQNLPGFIAMCPGMPNVGAQLWSSAYLPSIYQGTYVPCNESEPEKMIQHLVNRRVSPSEQHRELELVNALNKLDMERRGHDSMLEGRIQSMEVAFRMQTEALDAFDIAKESEATRLRYGITPPTALQCASKLRSATRDGDFARGCLVARRLVERGVNAAAGPVRHYRRHRAAAEDRRGGRPPRHQPLKPGRGPRASPPRPSARFCLMPRRSFRIPRPRAAVGCCRPVLGQARFPTRSTI